MWSFRHPPLDHLDEVDSDVVPSELRRADLGIPDGVWWVAFFLGAIVTSMAMLDWTMPHLGKRAAQCLFFGWSSAVMLFATERWGHRRYTFRRAFRDSGKILFSTVAFAGLLIVWSAFER